MAAYVYMVECADDSYYTGWTNDVEARIAAHNDGAGARYTRGRGPVRLVYWEEAADKKMALRRERAIKKLSRAQKEKLVGIFAEGCDSGMNAGGMQRCMADQPNREV
ncbi:MAG: GIY-YIG nuclease family protein [Negativicutes bacterium]